MIACSLKIFTILPDAVIQSASSPCRRKVSLKLTADPHFLINLPMPFSTPVTHCGAVAPCRARGIFGLAGGRAPRRGGAVCAAWARRGGGRRCCGDGAARALPHEPDGDGVGVVLDEVPHLAQPRVRGGAQRAAAHDAAHWMAFGRRNGSVALVDLRTLQPLFAFPPSIHALPFHRASHPSASSSNTKFLCIALLLFWHERCRLRVFFCLC
jgi:hypothetical protein